MIEFVSPYVADVTKFLIKVHIFWEGNNILQNLHLTFDCMYCSQKLGEDFENFCGILRIYELYKYDPKFRQIVKTW